MTDRADNFTRADTTSAIGTPSDGGSAWSQISGTWGISSNAGYMSGVTTQAICALESNVSNVTLQVTLNGTPTDCGICARVADNSNYLIGIASAAFGTFIYKVVAGSFAEVSSNSGVNWVAGDVMKFTMDASNLLTVYRNGSSVTSGTNAAGSANTMHGLRSNADGTVRFNTFSITGTAAAASNRRTLGPRVGSRSYY